MDDLQTILVTSAERKFRGHLDIAVHDLSDENAALREDVASLRLLLSAALEQLHEATVREGRRLDLTRQLTAEVRALRAAARQEPAA